MSDFQLLQDLIPLLADRDDVFHSPSTIANFAGLRGYVHGSTPQEIYWEKQRIRLACLRLVSFAECLPADGDGLVTIEGQAPFPGWTKGNWEQALREYQEHRAHQAEQEPPEEPTPKAET